MTSSPGAGRDDDVAADSDVTIDPDRTADQTPQSMPAADGGGSRARGAVAGVLGVLAILVLTMTAVAVWATAVVFDSEKVADIVGDALAEPEVSAALADYLTDQVFTLVDIDAVLADVLPTQLQRIEPVLAAGARTAVDRGLGRVLASPEVQEVIVTVVERAHRRAMDLLAGDGLVDGIDVTDGEVTVNLLPLIGRGVGQLQELGLLTNLTMPDLSASGDPAEQVAALSETIGRDLPDDFGQLVVYRSESLADAQASLQNAQRIFALSKRAVWLLAALTIALVAVTVLVAQHRWRATLFLGLGAVAAMVITRSAAHRVVDEAPALAARPGGRAAISAIVAGASTGLLRLAGILVIVAVVAIVAALYRRRWPTSDLILVAAVVAGVAVVAIIGVSAVSLLTGIVVAAAVVLVAGRVIGRRPVASPS